MIEPRLQRLQQCRRSRAQALRGDWTPATERRMRSVEGVVKDQWLYSACRAAPTMDLRQSSMTERRSDRDQCLRANFLCPPSGASGGGTHHCRCRPRLGARHHRQRRHRQRRHRPCLRGGSVASGAAANSTPRRWVRRTPPGIRGADVGSGSQSLLLRSTGCSSRSWIAAPRPRPCPTRRSGRR